MIGKNKGSSPVLAGAELGIPKKALPHERKAALRAFFDNLQDS